MAWTVELSDTAAKSLAKLDPQVARRITKFLRTKVTDDPRTAGKAMVGPMNLWRYRVGDFRVVVSIEDARLVVLVIRIGHRREVYR